MFSPIEEFDVINKLNIIFSNYDISLNQVSIYVVITILFIILFVLLFLIKVKIVPYVGQMIFEDIYKFILGLIKDQMGSKGFIYFPFICSLFFFILFANLLGLSPFGISITSYMGITFFFSLTIWLGMTLLGFSLYKLKFLKMFTPDVNIELLIILIVIDLISYIIRAFSLAIRLSANITAGHTLLNVISGLNLGVLHNLVLFFPITLGLILLILVLELGIAFVQSYVFIMLFSIYINDVYESAGGH
jgi:F-type H+-transporting ATPase subunit a